MKQVKYLMPVIFLMVIFQAIAQEEEEKEEEEMDYMFEMTLEELLEVEIVTASNKSEKLSKAPATIIVITEQEIRERGYFELFDVLNDLPGIDLSRAFGDDNYYAYIRGYRKTTSDQMLLMVDGIIMNHLYNNNMNAYAQYPLQNIKQIEIVYGPASAIYGPNAFSGVINMITKKDAGSTIQATTGQNNTNIIDLHVSEKVDAVGINFAGRFYQSDGPDLEGRTPSLENDLFTDPHLWGGAAQTNFSGYQSPIETNFIHPSVSLGGLTVGAISYFYESGLGSEFAGGTTLNAATWQFKENTVYAKYEKTIDKLSSKTLLKYRRSDIPGSSAFLWRWLDQGVDTVVVTPGNVMTQYGLNIPNNGATDNTYIVDGNYIASEYWQANNASFSFFQDFTYQAQDNLTINFGLKYDRRILNRDYIINSNYSDYNYFVYNQSDYTLNVGTDMILNDPTSSDFSFPARPDDATLDQENHNTLIDRGIYVQGQYSPNDMITIFTGLRYDHNSVWKEVWSPRIGVVAEPMSGLVAKLFFGTAFLEPSARILYGGWSGSLSNDKLTPERMRTFEASLNYIKGSYSVGLNGFYNIAPDAIGTATVNGVKKVPINLGERKMIGGELNFKYLYRNQGAMLSKFRGDLYLSYIQSEEDLSDTGDFKETGNMAPVKLKFILTAFLKDRLSVSFQNRFVDEISTVDSNPIDKIDGYFVSDLFLQYDDILVKGLSLGVKIYNWMDVDYFHPGYRDADAGEGNITDILYNTSWYNSRLPQPERTFLVNMRFQF